LGISLLGNSTVGREYSRPECKPRSTGDKARHAGVLPAQGVSSRIAFETTGEAGQDRRFGSRDVAPPDGLRVQRGAPSRTCDRLASWTAEGGAIYGPSIRVAVGNLPGARGRPEKVLTGASRIRVGGGPEG